MCMLLLLFLFWLLFLCRRCGYGIGGDGALDASVCVCLG